MFEIYWILWNPELIIIHTRDRLFSHETFRSQIRFDSAIDLFSRSFPNSTRRQVFRLSQRQVRSTLSSGMLSRVTWYKYTYVSEVFFASIITAKALIMAAENVSRSKGIFFGLVPNNTWLYHHHHLITEKEEINKDYFHNLSSLPRIIRMIKSRML